MSKYEVTPIDGILDYGPAHSRRQSDAQDALDQLTDLDSALRLWVMDGDRTVAKVYQTQHDDELRYVIRLTPERRITPSLAKINKEQGRTGEARIHHTGQAIVDPLEAPDDRELEVSTRQGVVRLDRRKVLERLGFGQQSAGLQEVAEDA